MGRKNSVGSSDNSSVGSKRYLQGGIFRKAHSSSHQQIRDDDDAAYEMAELALQEIPAFICDKLTLTMKGKFDKARKCPKDDKGFPIPIKSMKMVDEVSFYLESKQALAIVGPSGSGKTTLFRVLAFLVRPDSGSCYWQGQRIAKGEDMASLCVYVEQDECHIGTLTVRETLTYASKLSGPAQTAAVDTMLDEMGLQECADVIVGTPILQGISGGQKKRLSIACALIQNPAILLLDEPVSGLDSMSSAHIIRLLTAWRRRHGTIIIASLHSPTMDILRSFTQIMMIIDGEDVFQGSLQEAESFCFREGIPVAAETTPINVMMGLSNPGNYSHLFQTMLDNHAGGKKGQWEHTSYLASRGDYKAPPSSRSFKDNVIVVYWLCHRLVIDYLRNWLAFILRMGMFAGMGFLLATIWIHLGTEDVKINDRMSVHFFSVAFLSFMSVAGIPAFIEERRVFMKERRSALYGPLAFVVSNTLVVIPFVFGCSLFYSVIIYWAIGLHSGAVHFFKFLAFLFLALLVAETQSALIAATVPIFVGALAVTAFANGFWMCVQGFFIRTTSLPRFWYYVFHFIDYQTYAFEALVKNDLVGLAFNCVNYLKDGSCNCAYPPSQTTLDTLGQCKVTGQDVIDTLGFTKIPMLGNGLVLVGMFLLLRVCLYLTLRFRTKR